MSGSGTTASFFFPSPTKYVGCFAIPPCAYLAIPPFANPITPPLSNPNSDEKNPPIPAPEPMPPKAAPIFPKIPPKKSVSPLKGSFIASFSSAIAASAPPVPSN